ncbi:MAG: 50S ribosomal protein L28 [Fusobacteriaceae bacterium]|jgi:large subunit ribosomal protein L28|nr:50S ribosomal protein L28 [Fusobacteriaceae bacterium]
MQRCEITGTGLISGNLISHSHRLTKRVWKPNLQVATININGNLLKIKVCARTLKKLKSSNDAEVLQYLKENKGTLSPRITKLLAK